MSAVDDCDHGCGLIGMCPVHGKRPYNDPDRLPRERERRAPYDEAPGRQ